MEKETKTFEDQRKKQIKAIGNRAKRQFSDLDQKSIVSFFLKDFLNEEAKYELNKFVEKENKFKLNRDDLVYRTGNKKG